VPVRDAALRSATRSPAAPPRARGRAPGLLGLLALLVLAAAARAQRVVVVVLDDVGTDRIAAYGENPDAGPTPHLDALAHSGLMFRECYANPSCSPTRCEMLTGRYGFRTGIGRAMSWNPSSSGVEFELTSGVFLPSLLPCPTACVGKYHLTESDFMHPITVCGFGRHTGAIGNLAAFPGDGYFSWKRNVATASGAAQTQSTVYATTATVDDALPFLRRNAHGSFFLWLAFNAAHNPFHVPPSSLQGFAGLDEGSPASLKFRAMVEAMDTEIGRLMRNLPQDTTVIVIGDNGTPDAAATPPLSQGYKSSLYQGGVHVPLIVDGPLVRAPGREVTAIVHAVDVFATVLDLFGLPNTTGVDSVSMRPYLERADAPPQRDWVYSEYFEPNGFDFHSQDDRMATDGHWKLIEHLGGASELYDLDHDPLEQLDLWPPDNAERIAIVESLQQVLDSLK